MKINKRKIVPFALGLATLALDASLIHQAQAGAWLTGPSLITARQNHTATLLPNGKVLVAGGLDTNSNPLSSAEIHDPATGTWTATGSMTTPRREYTATLLNNGKVLVAGGYGTSSLLSSAEIYDPTTGKWTATGATSSPRWFSTATLLPGGKVLVAGGYRNSHDETESAELYDPATGTWTATGSLSTRRHGHSTTLLPNGKVLAVGGCYITNSTVYHLPSAELYDPATGTWTATGSMIAPRLRHTATLLSNGKVLVAAGVNGSPLSSAELYNPSTETWTATGGLPVARGEGHTATLLSNGTVLLAGGGYYVPYNWVYHSSSHLYDPGTGAWTATGSLMSARGWHTATLLPDGRLLVTGGEGGEGGDALSSAELYDRAAVPWASRRDEQAR